jgi:hypothetical protein
MKVLAKDTLAHKQYIRISVLTLYRLQRKAQLEKQSTLLCFECIYVINHVSEKKTSTSTLILQEVLGRINSPTFPTQVIYLKCLNLI